MNRGTLFRVFLRSFFLQGSFSARYRQSLGFAYAVEPAGRLIWPGDEEYHRFMVRHTEQYNGNPFMSTLVQGAVIHMEERLRDGGTTEEDIRRFKKIVAPATGSSGDWLFWNNLRPFSLIAGVSFALVFGVWGAVLFLALFNASTWYLKLRWLFRGYTLGPKVVIEIRNQFLERFEQGMEVLGSALAGFASAGACMALDPGFFPRGIVCAGAALVFVFGFILYRRQAPLHLAVTGALAFAVVLGFLTLGVV
jgi:PTS system mannose-specific IID component